MPHINNKTRDKIYMYPHDNVQTVYSRRICNARCFRKLEEYMGLYIRKGRKSGCGYKEGNRAEVSWISCSRVHDVGQPAHDEGSHFSGGTVEGTAAPTLAWSVPWCRRAWLARLLAPGQGLDPVAVAVNQLSVTPESSSTLSQCLPTAPLHCLLVGV